MMSPILTVLIIISEIFLFISIIICAIFFISELAPLLIKKIKALLHKNNKKFWVKTREGEWFIFLGWENGKCIKGLDTQ